MYILTEILLIKKKKKNRDPKILSENSVPKILMFLKNASKFSIA